MFLGGWQLWIKTFCHLTNILAIMQLFAFCGQKLYFAKSQRRESQKLFGHECLRVLTYPRKFPEL